MSKVKDLSGEVFGRWAVLHRGENDTRGNAQWLCKCSCGVEREVVGYGLREGTSRSCGCLKIEELKKSKSLAYPDRDRSLRESYIRKLRHLKRCYNLTETGYRRLQDKARGVCEICGESHRLEVDHNHDTGLVRGLLCHHCNTAIGSLKESQEILGKAISYLDSWEV